MIKKEGGRQMKKNKENKTKNPTKTQTATTKASLRVQDLPPEQNKL